jgi:hypothetical protein
MRGFSLISMALLEARCVTVSPFQGWAALKQNENGEVTDRFNEDGGWVGARPDRASARVVPRLLRLNNPNP